MNRISVCETLDQSFLSPKYSVNMLKTYIHTRCTRTVHLNQIFTVKGAYPGKLRYIHRSCTCGVQKTHWVYDKLHTWSHGRVTEPT